MSSDDVDKFVENSSKGATKAILEWSEEKLANFIKKFKDKELAFVKDTKIVETAKEIRNKSEYQIFKKYVNNKEYGILCQMGMTLRRLHSDNEEKAIIDLRQKIFNKYDKQGLHIAQFVQNGSFSKLIGNLLDKEMDDEKLKKKILSFFKNIETRTAFIKSKDDIKKKCEEIKSKIYANSPETFIISAVGDARENGLKIVEKTNTEFDQDYVYEQYKSKTIDIYFFNQTATDL